MKRNLRPPIRLPFGEPGFFASDQKWVLPGGTVDVGGIIGFSDRLLFFFVVPGKPSALLLRE